MNLAKFLVFALLMAVVTARPALADDRKDIEALYSKLLQALVNNHPEETLNYETPDFVAIGQKGETKNGAQLVEEFKKNAMMMKIGTPEIKVVKCQIKGKSADVYADLVLSNKFVDTRGDNGPKGQSHLMEVITNLHNSLVKGSDGWKFKTMKQLGPQKMMMDGKPLGPKKKTTAPATKAP